MVPGNGLDGMRARVQALGGTLQVEGARGSGTTVLARVPRPAPVAANHAVGAAMAAMKLPG